ncbi:MAG: c-type cytochrome domain-containing protein [Terracidiphilus sp.]
MKKNSAVAMPVNRLLPQSKATRLAWIASLALSVTLILLPWLIKLDGKQHSDWQQFLGRFHPLAVHLPIGLLVLVPLLEITGAFRPALREAAAFVLGLAFASSLLALTLGFLLAYGGGDAGLLLTRHIAGGITLTIGVLLCLLARPWWLSGSVAYVYPALLTCTLLALVWTADLGGSITHGSNYLTQYMPNGLKRIALLGTDTPPATSFYAKHINPILDANCVACHGEAKAQGGLRMDSFSLLMQGGKDGPVIVAGSADNSLLFQRVTLPPGHKQFMPAEGKPPLRADEIALIRAWVQQGASPTAATLAGISLHEEQPEPPLQPVGDYSALAPEIHQMQQSQGAKLIPVSVKPEDGLVLYTVDAASSFGDAQLAQFQKFVPYIVEAELGRTAVTNASFDTLKQFTHLRALHMEETHITGDALAKLAPLSQLTYINLSGTQVTSAAVAPLSTMKNLRHVYLYNTPAQPAPAAEHTQPIARNAP